MRKQNYGLARVRVARWVRGGGGVDDECWNDSHTPTRYVNGNLKRSLDVVLGLSLTIFTSPLVIFLAIGSALSFRAWPFFVQVRLGKNGKFFNFVKIRSLPTSTLATADKYDVSKIVNTRFGSFLRSLHLDEIPQFWLVVTGRMSLVGPRPEFPELAQKFDQQFVSVRTRVRPGITGPWQISVASRKLIGELPESDYLYVKSADLRFDFWILGRTFLEMLGRNPLTYEQVSSHSFVQRRLRKRSAVESCIEGTEDFEDGIDFAQ